jgi:hypothetical protein
MALGRLRVDGVRHPPAAWGALPALALALLAATVGAPGTTRAQELEPVVGADGEIHLLTRRPEHVHRGWTFGFEVGIGDATAFGGGQTYSLSSLAGGDSNPKLSLLLLFGHAVGENLRLDLALGGTVANSTTSGLASSAALDHAGLELSWLPRGDGLFLRGGVGWAWLMLSSDSGQVTRDLTLSGLDVTAGVGWFSAPWREAYPTWTGHLMAAIDLGWEYYFENGAVNGQIRTSLRWSLRVGFHTW